MDHSLGRRFARERGPSPRITSISAHPSEKLRAIPPGTETAVSQSARFPLTTGTGVASQRISFRLDEDAYVSDG